MAQHFLCSIPVSRHACNLAMESVTILTLLGLIMHDRLCQLTVATKALGFHTTSTCRRKGCDGADPEADDFDTLVAARAFERHRRDLVPLAGSAINLLQYLTSKGLIPEATTRRILVAGLSTVDRSGAILDAIEARIRSNPGMFHALVSLLQRDYKLQHFAGRLMDSYRE